MTDTAAKIQEKDNAGCDGDIVPNDLVGVIELLLGLPEDTGFIEMCRRTGLDKTKDFMYASLAEIDFEDEDLTGYDFTGADLRDCDFSRAKVDGMIYVCADITDAKWPPHYIPDNGAGVPLAAGDLDLAI